MATQTKPSSVAAARAGATSLQVHEPAPPDSCLVSARLHPAGSHSWLLDGAMHTWWLQLTVWHLPGGMLRGGTLPPCSNLPLVPCLPYHKDKDGPEDFAAQNQCIFSPLHFLQNHQDWSGSQKPRQLPPSLELEVESH